MSQDLADRGGQVRLTVTFVHGADQLRHHLRLAGQALQRPGEFGGGGLVAGDQQGEQFVVDLLVRHR